MSTPDEVIAQNEVDDMIEEEMIREESPVEEEAIDFMSKMMQHQQLVNMNMLSNFLTHGDKNICCALLEIKSAIDTNSRCLLKLHDLLEKKIGEH